MFLGVGEVQRLGRLGDKADEALAGTHDGEVDRLAVEALGGVELESPVDAQHIDRADLGHHVGRDQHHDLVEAFLRRDLLRHHLAEATEQEAGSAECGAHRHGSGSGAIKPRLGDDAAGLRRRTTIKGAAAGLQRRR